MPAGSGDRVQRDVRSASMSYAGLCKNARGSKTAAGCSRVGSRHDGSGFSRGRGDGRNGRGLAAGGAARVVAAPRPRAGVGLSPDGSGRRRADGAGVPRVAGDPWRDRLDSDSSTGSVARERPTGRRRSSRRVPTGWRSSSGPTERSASRRRSRRRAGPRRWACCSGRRRRVTRPSAGGRSSGSSGRRGSGCLRRTTPTTSSDMTRCWSAGPGSTGHTPGSSRRPWRCWPCVARGWATHPRVVEGYRLIRDRAIVTGGWNYGNKSAFGHPLRPQPAPTGLALLALAGRDERTPIVDGAIRYLHGRCRASGRPPRWAGGCSACGPGRALRTRPIDWLAEAYQRATGRPDAARETIPAPDGRR